MTEHVPDTRPDDTGSAGSTDDPGTTDSAGGTDVAAQNRRRMREALDRKRGVAHPDDTAPGGSGVRGASPGGAKRDFSRRKSG